MSLQQNNCQLLKDKFGRLTAVGSLELLLKRGSTQGKKELDLMEQLTKERVELWQSYQQKARQLLRQWFDSDEFTDSIYFEDDGRVVVDTDLNLQQVNRLSYFPSLIRKVEGSLLISDPDFEHLDFIEEVGSLYLKNAKKIKSLNRLRKATNTIDIAQTSIESLPDLVEVGRELFARDLETLHSLPNLEEAGSLSLMGSGIEDLSALTRIQETINILGTSLTSLPKLQYVGFELQAYDSQLANLPELKEADNLNVAGTELTVIPKLESVGSFLNLGWVGHNGFRKAFPKLKEIGYLRNPRDIMAVRTKSPLVQAEIGKLIDSGELEVKGMVIR
jgi:hypothetical protein